MLMLLRPRSTWPAAWLPVLKSAFTDPDAVFAGIDCGACTISSVASRLSVPSSTRKIRRDVAALRPLTDGAT